MLTEEMALQMIDKTFSVVVLALLNNDETSAAKIVSKMQMDFARNMRES